MLRQEGIASFLRPAVFGVFRLRQMRPLGKLRAREGDGEHGPPGLGTNTHRASVSTDDGVNDG